LNHIGKVPGSLGNSSFKMGNGSGGNSGRMSAQNAGARVQAVQGHLPGFVDEPEHKKDSAEDIEQKIINEKIKMDETKANYLEKNGKLKEEDRHSIQEVADILKHMPDDLKKAKQK